MSTAATERSAADNEPYQRDVPGVEDVSPGVDTAVRGAVGTGSAAVAGLARRLFRLRGWKAPPQVPPGDLPELTDEWFEETIREVDEASARLKVSAAQVKQTRAA